MHSVNCGLSCPTVCSLQWESWMLWGKRSVLLKINSPSLPLSGQYFFVSCCELQRGPFNSMGQLQIPSCLILTAGMLVCVVTSSLVRESGGAGRGNEQYALSSLTLAPACPHSPHLSPSLFISFSLLLSFSVLPGVKDESNWCETLKNEFGHVCHLQSGKEGRLGPGHHHSAGIICYSALIGPDKTIP